MEKITCTHCNAENSIRNKYCSNCGYELKTKNTIDAEHEKQQPVDKSPSEGHSAHDNELSKDSGQSKKTQRIATIVGAVMFVIAYFLVQYFFFPPLTVDEIMAKTATKVNKDCPMMVDEFTRLDNAQSMPNKRLQYNYTLIEHTVSEVNLDTAARYIKPNIIDNVRTNPDMKYIRDNDVTLIYNYKDKNGVFVVQYEITPEMYK